MIYTVYGLRRHGETGARYIGQTSLPPIFRLRSHFGEAMARRRGKQTELTRWLLANRGHIEIFQISEHATVADARRSEREMVAACVALGLPIFNQWLVPAPLRNAA